MRRHDKLTVTGYERVDGSDPPTFSMEVFSDQPSYPDGMCGCDCHRLPDAYCAKVCCSGARPVPDGTVIARQSFDKMLNHWANTGQVARADHTHTQAPTYPIVACQGCQAEVELMRMRTCSDPVQVRRMRQATGDVLLRGSLNLCADCYEIARGVA